MNFSHLMQRLQIFGSSVDLPMEPKTLGLLVVILFFLISLLLNLLQHRYSKARFNRMLTMEESVVNFLLGIDKYLAEVEWTCTIEMKGASSPQEMGKAVHGARKKIESTIADMGKHLRSFRQYRRKEKAREKLKKRLENSPQGPSGR
jgi:hypothetical protein